LEAIAKEAIKTVDVNTFKIDTIKFISTAGGRDTWIARKGNEESVNVENILNKVGELYAVKVGALFS